MFHVCIIEKPNSSAMDWWWQKYMSNNWAKVLWGVCNFEYTFNIVTYREGLKKCPFYRRFYLGGNSQFLIFFIHLSDELIIFRCIYMLPSMTTVLALLYYFPFNFLTGYLFDYFQMTTILACSSPRTWSWQSRFSIIFHSSFQ